MHWPVGSMAGAFFIGTAASVNGGSGGEAQTNCLGRMGTGRVRGLGLGGCGLGLAAGAATGWRGLAAGGTVFGRPAPCPCPARPAAPESPGLGDGFAVPVRGGRAGVAGGGSGGTPSGAKGVAAPPSDSPRPSLRSGRATGAVPASGGSGGGPIGPPADAGGGTGKRPAELAAAGGEASEAGRAGGGAPGTSLNSPIAWRWHCGHFSGTVSRWTSAPHDVQR